MNRRSCLAACMLALTGCAASSPSADRPAVDDPGAEQLATARVAFRVTGMQKTRSGAT